tara:strand:+ start:10570 stop:13218 length:2649 start_codon:yes stop_codon:yes gene_type:complete
MAFTDHVKVMLGLDSRGFNDGLNQAETKIQRFARTMQNRFIGSLGTAAIAATTTKIIDFGAAIGDMSDRLGVSSTFLQELQFAAEQSGISADTAATALQRFTRRVAEAQANGGALADTLRSLNISMVDSQGQARTTEDMFRDFGIALTGMQNPAERLRIAFQFLDTEGAALTQMFQQGKPSLDDYANSARNLGLILENDTVRALQNASGKLEQAKRQFTIFSAEVFPPLIRFLQNAKLGFDLLALAIPNVGNALRVLGGVIQGEIMAKFELLAAAANRAAQEIIHPFRSISLFGLIGGDIEESERLLRASIQRLEQAQIESARTLADRKRQIFEEDIEQQNIKENLQTRFNELQERFNEVNGRKLQTNDRANQQLNANLGKHQAIVEEANKEKNAVDAINGLRQQEERTLERTLERIEAMRNGGEDALRVVEQRHDQEDQINRLMEQGNMTRQQAVTLVTQIVQAENQELRLQQQIKAEQQRKVDLKDQEADRQAIIQKLQEENRLHQAGRQLESDKLRILQMRAQGRNEEADKLQQQLDINRQIEQLQNRLNLQGGVAVNHLERKLGLENQILQKKNEQQQADLRNAAIQEQAQRDIGDAIDANDRARIRAARAVQGLEQQILALQAQGGDRAQREIDRLNAVKERKLELVLDDQTRADLAQLEQERLQIEDQHAEQMQALQNRRAEIAQEAADKQRELQRAAAQKEADLQRQKANAEQDLQQVGNQVQQGLGQALTAGEQAIRDAGEAIRLAIMRLIPGGGGMGDIHQTPVNNSINLEVETDHLATESTLRNILAAIQENGQVPDFSDLQGSLSQAIAQLGNRIAGEIQNLNLPPGGPGAPEPTPVNNYINLEVDTESLAKDATMEEIIEILQGRFVNEN